MGEQSPVPRLRSLILTTHGGVYTARESLTPFSFDASIIITFPIILILYIYSFSQQYGKRVNWGGGNRGIVTNFRIKNVITQSAVTIPRFSCAGRLLPEPALREFIPLMCFLAEPVGDDQFPSVGIIVGNTARPAAPCMDAGTADPGVIVVMFEVVAEVTDQRIVDPDLADTVFPQRTIHKFGNGLPDPAEGNLAGPEDAKDADNPAIIGLSFRAPDLSEWCECRRCGQNNRDRGVRAKFFVHVPHQFKVPVIVEGLPAFMHRDTPPGMGHRVEFHGSLPCDLLPAGPGRRSGAGCPGVQT